jgi:hypothetical protein
MTVKESIINAIAGAVVLAAGGTIVGLKVNDAKQDERIARIEDLDRSVDGLRVDLRQVDGKLERLNGRLEGEHEPRK